MTGLGRPSPVIEVRDLCKSYDDKVVIDHLSFGRRLTFERDPTRLVLGAGFQLSQLAVCVLVISNEYASGTIRAGLLAVPRQTPILSAKALVLAILVIFVAEVAAFGSFAIGAPIPDSKIPVTIGEHIHAYLPTEAGQLVASAQQGPDDLLSPWQGLGVFCLWTVGLMVVAADLLRRRDA